MKDLAAKLARPSALLWIGLSLLIVWAVRQVPFAGVGQVLRSVSLVVIGLGAFIAWSAWPRRTES